jgi:hypothetical protein
MMSPKQKPTKICTINHVNIFLQKFIDQQSQIDILARRAELITISLTYAEVPVFFKDLGDILQTLKERIGWLYIPVNVQSKY